ncbi:MAG: hypothetical protein JO297_16885 [Nitrososphaeraceae archaeon]|nr:hypothetical protein [Nitrososphaeraceae archaeon]
MSSETSDSRAIHIVQSLGSYKNGTPSIAEGEEIEKTDSSHLQIRHSKFASVLTSDDIDSSDEEEAGS